MKCTFSYMVSTEYIVYITQFTLRFVVCFLAIFYSLSILGPAVGFLLGGIFLNIYTDAASVDVEKLVSPS